MLRSRGFIVSAGGSRPLLAPRHATTGLRRPSRVRASRKQDPPAKPQVAQHPRGVVAGARAAAAAAAAALVGLLPPGAAHALDALAGLDGLPAYYEAPLDLEPAYVDPAAGGLLDAMFVVVVTYAALLAVYMALSSMIDEDTANSWEDPSQPRGQGRGGPATSGSGTSRHQRQRGDQQHGEQARAGGATSGDEQQGADGLPPSYAQYLHANIRSVREPKRAARHELVLPEGLDQGGIGGVKAALAAQAAEYVAQQTRECRAVVRRKLYLRRLVAKDAPKLPPGHAAGLAAAHHAAAPATALQLGAPGALELMVDDYLDSMPEDLLRPDGEDSLVRSISGIVARRLAAAEVGLLVRSMQAAVKERDASETGLLVW